MSSQLLNLDDFLTQEEQKAILWVWQNHSALEQAYLKRDYIFDFPDYGNIPEDLSPFLTLRL